MRDVTSLPLITQLPAQPPAQPWVPLAPVLSRAAFRQGSRAHVPSVLDAGQVRLVTSGRIAIGLALRAMGVGAGDIVLMPAYHSLSMIPPVLWREAEARFYRVTREARVDLADLAMQYEPRVKALVVTHYFGFMQDMAPIRAWCDRHGVALLEDCAHCFFGPQAGMAGDYAIASSMKFFPAYEGGALVSRRHDLRAIALHSAGAGFELKVVLNTLEHGFAYGRLAPLRLLLALPLRVKDVLWRARKAGRASAPALAPASSDSAATFDPAWLDRRSSWFARLLLRRVDHGRIVALRRTHYAQLEAALADLPGARPLHAVLPAATCPWMFPLVVDDADAVFTQLHRAGVPVTRFAEVLWAGVDAAVCANSVYLARHVLAFPCHQELRPDELAWMTARIRAALQA